MNTLLLTFALVLGLPIGEPYTSAGGGHGGGGPKAPLQEPSPGSRAASGAEHVGATDSPHASLALELTQKGSSLI